MSLWSSYRVKQRSEWQLLVRLVIGLSDDAFHGIFIERDLHTCNWVSIGAPSWPMMGRSNPGALHQMKLEKTVNGWAATAEDTGGHSYKVQLITSSGPTVEQMAYMLWLCLQETLEQQIYIQQTDPWLPGSRVGKEIKDEMGFLEGKRIRNSGNGLALEIEMFSLPKTIKNLFLTCIDKFTLDYRIIFSPQNNHKCWANYITGCWVKFWTMITTRHRLPRKKYTVSEKHRRRRIKGNNGDLTV